MNINRIILMPWCCNSDQLPWNVIRYNYFFYISRNWNEKGLGVKETFFQLNEHFRFLICQIPIFLDAKNVSIDSSVWHWTNRDRLYRERLYKERLFFPTVSIFFLRFVVHMALFIFFYLVRVYCLLSPFHSANKWFFSLDTVAWMVRLFAKSWIHFFPFFQLAVERSHVNASHILRYSIFILLVCTCFLFGTLCNLLFLYSMWSGPAKRSLTPMQA